VAVHSNRESKDGSTWVIKLSRPIESPAQDMLAFDPMAASLKIIVATGCDIDFAQHCGRTPNVVHFLPLDTQQSIYRAGIQGSIVGTTEVPISTL
jgi:hypothetical protein